MSCSGVVVLSEIVVKGVLLCGCVGFGVGIGIRVERVLPRGVGCGPVCCGSVLSRSGFVGC